MTQEKEAHLVGNVLGEEETSACVLYVGKIFDTCQITQTVHFPAATFPRKLENYTTGG